MQTKKYKGIGISLVLAVGVLILMATTSKYACAAGTCDTEDFYPSSYYHSKLTSEGQIDIIITGNLWTKKSQYFASGYYFSFDFYRTVSCTDGSDKDVYDYYDYYTDLPAPHRENVEEWNPWNPICYIVPRVCNEEVEIGTENPQNIQTGVWYRVVARFTVKKHESYAMHIEPEVEPATTITPPPWEEWCELACYNTRAGTTGW
ncbi:hypothetical protein [Pyrobaculum aerophilum]|uniref:hypothetical protein n=1 Tax=Pyrobaculum aerophilum TaxID=13773 RepID=UPI0023F48D99|nr:hypothetical protein [Pyrobaculum aerophilum]MCX8137377.1 hypothetical protein [Pyrobaculum aerophilum]